MTKSSDRLLIGNVLKSIRIKKDIPIKQIAKKMNVSESMISQLETGKNNFSKDKIIVYTNICGCSFNFSIKTKYHNPFRIQKGLSKVQLNYEAKSF